MGTGANTQAHKEDVKSSCEVTTRKLLAAKTDTGWTRSDYMYMQVNAKNDQKVASYHFNVFKI